MRSKLLLIILIGTPVLLSILVINGRRHRGPGDAQAMAIYAKQVRNIDKEWDKFATVSGSDSVFSNQVKALVTNSAENFQLDNDQKASLTDELLNFFEAYRFGSYEAYKRYRIPSAVPHKWVTNKLGSVSSALKAGSTIALPKALQRWNILKKEGVNWAEKATDESFLAYLKLYSGDTLYSNYFTGVAFDQSRIVFSNYQKAPITPPWKVEFTTISTNLGEFSYASAPVQFLNMGYMSQKKYSFIQFENSVEDTMAHYGSVTVADCFLFVKRQDADRNLPVIARFYWEPRSLRWLPDDLVVCNMERKGDFWPLF